MAPLNLGTIPSLSSTSVNRGLQTAERSSLLHERDDSQPEFLSTGTTVGISIGCIVVGLIGLALAIYRIKLYRAKYRTEYEMAAKNPPWNAATHSTLESREAPRVVVPNKKGIVVVQKGSPYVVAPEKECLTTASSEL